MKIRPATVDDLQQIIDIYYRDPIVGDHQPELVEIDKSYRETFSLIDKDSNQLLLVAEQDGVITGTVQVTCIQYLLGRLIKSAVVEALFVHPDFVNSGIGTSLMVEAEGWARENNCYSIRLTSNRERRDAHRFYEGLGYVDNHIAYKKLIV